MLTPTLDTWDDLNVNDSAILKSKKGTADIMNDIECEGAKAFLTAHPEQEKTEERQGGGNVPASGEKHGQKKAGAIPANRRYDGADRATLKNSPGRASADVRDEE